MKVWKEEWDVDHDRVVVHGDDSDHLARFSRDDAEETYVESYARARLAAAAPDMARALLEAYDMGGLCCSVCSESNHDPDCAIVVALRKAGVIE